MHALCVHDPRLTRNKHKQKATVHHSSSTTTTTTAAEHMPVTSPLFDCSVRLDCVQHKLSDQHLYKARADNKQAHEYDCVVPVLLVRRNGHCKSGI